MRQDTVIVGVLIFLAGIISIEIGFSTAILEILAGVLASNVLGVHSVEWLDFLADFGLVGIMFYAGFEVDPKLLKQNLIVNIFLGAIAYFIPLIAIFSILSTFLGFPFRKVLLIAISLSTTSLALVYAVLREKKIIEKEYSQIILGGALITDVLSILSLPFLAGTFPLSAIFYVALAIIFMFLSPKLGKWVFSRYRRSLVELEMRLVLLLLIILPLIAERTLISEAVLAFLLGVLFSEIVEEDVAIQEKLRGIIFGFLAPAFFFRAGLFINLSTITINSVILLLLLIPLTFVAKYLSVFVTSWVCVGREVSKIAGLFFVFNLTFGIIAAVYGLSAGIIDTELYTVLLLTILVTTLVSSIILRVTPEELYEQTFT